MDALRIPQAALPYFNRGKAPLFLLFIPLKFNHFGAFSLHNCDIQGGANVLIFPDLHSSNIAYKLMQRMGGAEAIGPLLVGMNKPINILQRSADVDEIVNVAMITALEIQQARNKGKKEKTSPPKVLNHKHSS